MTNEETLALWQRCEDARTGALVAGKSKSEAHALASAVWMEWARPLVDRRKELEGKGVWSVSRNVTGRLIGQNIDTIEFLAKADAIFSTRDHPYTFTSDALFNGWVFPGRAEYNSATFAAGTTFASAVFADAADFKEAQFQNRVDFLSATFLADSSFSGAELARAAFQRAQFVGAANLSAKFLNDAEFGLVQFQAPADFSQARFERRADFSGGQFAEDAVFFDVAFESTVVFRQVSFAGYTTFAKSHFKGAANFQAMKAERAFSLESTSFEAVPDFIQAHFAEAPRLDNANFKNLGGDRRQADTSLPARFRALKRLAVSGHDTERELEFNAAEILSRRHVEDHPFGRNAARFWLGWLYQEVSDFGRSIVKPIRLWLLLSVLFALLYLGPWTGRDISLHGLSSCVEVPNRHLTTPVPIRLSTNAVWEALQLSFRNGAFVFGSADANVEWNTLGCLYGASEDHPNVRRMPRTAAAAAMAQRTLSATLIFLFGMALRNMLKMK